MRKKKENVSECATQIENRRVSGFFSPVTDNLEKNNEYKRNEDFE